MYHRISRGLSTSRYRKQRLDRVSLASIQILIFFSLYPFANICSAVVKLHAVRLATPQKTHYVAIDYANVLQIQDDVGVVRLAFKKPPQLGYRLGFDAAAQDEYCESPSRGGFNPESH